MQYSEIAIHSVSSLFFLCCALYMFSLSSLFNYHPFCLVIGYGVLMGEAIMYSRYIKSRSRKYWLRVHLILQLVGYLFVTIGFSVIVWNKISREKAHFQSWHALLGLFAYIITSIQIIFGLLIYFFRKQLIKMTHVTTAVKVSKFHGYSGLVSHLFSMLVVCLGYCSNYARSKFGYELSSILIFFTAVISILVILTKPPKKVNNNNNTNNNTNSPTPTI